jgi:hypothetical protein
MDETRLRDVKMQDASAEAIATALKRFCAPS